MENGSSFFPNPVATPRRITPVKEHVRSMSGEWARLHGRWWDVSRTAKRIPNI